MENEVSREASLVNQEINKPQRDKLGRLLPGNTANPEGRPKGKTIKERVRDWLEEHPEDMEDYVQHFIKKNRELSWQMLEGKPQQDVTTGGQPLPFTIIIEKPDGGEKS